MATIVGKRSNVGPDPVRAAIASALAGQSLASVRDSLSASRYAVSSINPGGTPSLVGAQITGGTSGASKPLQPTGVTPGQYGDSSHIVQFTVNAQGLLTQARALPFSAGGAPIQVKTVTAPYTVAGADVPAASAYRGAIVVNSGSATNVTIDTFANTSIPIGAQITFMQEGAGAVTILPAAGVSFVGVTTTGAGQGAVGSAVQIAQDVWSISGALAWSAGPDPYWNNVKFLLHGNGANNGTVFTDEKGSTWSASSGTPITSTTQSKFNGSSIYLNGSSGLSTPANSSWHVGTQDFTLDAWVYLTSAGSPVLMQVLADVANAGYAETSWSMSNGRYGFLLETGNGVWTYEYGPAAGINAWHFIRATRASGSCNVWVDGVLAIGPFTAASVVSNSGASYIGQSATGQQSTGYLAELRYTLGVARTGTEVPTAPFPNS